MRIARLCLLLLLLLIPLLGGQAGVIPLAVFGVLTAFGWLGWASEKTASLPKTFPLRWPFAALIAVTVVTTFTSVYKPAGVLGIWQVVVLAGAAMLVCAVPLDRRQLFTGVLAFCAGSLASIAYGWYQWASWLVKRHELSWRILGAWENPNYFAAFLLITLPALVILARQSKVAPVRWGMGLLALLALVTLVMTQSRGGVLALLLCLLVFLPAWGWAEGRLSARTIGLGAVGFVILIGLMLLSPIGKRVLDPAVREKQFHSQMFRLYTWRGALRMARDYPWLGSGPNTFASAFGKYQEVGYTRNAHNIYLQAAAETGWPGMLVLLFFFAGIVSIGMQIIDKSAGNANERLLRVTAAVALLASLLGLLLHGLVDADWSYPGIQFTLVLQAMLVWRLAEQPPTVAPGKLRVLLPIVFLAVAALLLPGAYAKIYADKALNVTGPDVRAQRAALYRQAVGLAPTTAAYLREAAAYAPFEEGMKYLERAMRCEPTNAANWLYRGQLDQRYGDYRAALADFRTAETKQPYFFPALLGMAQVNLQLGDKAAGRTALEKIVKTQDGPRDKYRPIDVPEPFYTQAWYALACLDLQKDDRSAAVQAFEKALASGTKYTEEFQASSEAQAQAVIKGNTVEQDIVHGVLLWSYRQLEQLMKDTNPHAARNHRKEAETLRETYFKYVPAELFTEIPDSPFP